MFQRAFGSLNDRSTVSFIYVGEHPHIMPIPPLLRGRLHPPLDNTRMRVSEPDPTKLAKGIPDIKRLIPDTRP